MTIDGTTGPEGRIPPQPPKKPSIGKKRGNKGKEDKESLSGEIARKSLPEPETISSPQGHIGGEMSVKAKKGDLKGKGEQDTEEVARKSLEPGSLSEHQGHIGGAFSTRIPTKPPSRPAASRPIMGMKVAPPTAAGPAAADSPVKKEIADLRHIIKEIDDTNQSLDKDLENDLQVLNDPNFLLQLKNPGDFPEMKAFIDLGDPDFFLQLKNPGDIPEMMQFIEAFEEYYRVNNNFTHYFSTTLSTQPKDLTPQELKNVIQNLCNYFNGKGFRAYKRAALGVTLFANRYKAMLDSNKLSIFLADLSHEDSEGVKTKMSSHSFSTHVRVVQRITRFTLLLNDIEKNKEGVGLDGGLIRKAIEQSKEAASEIEVHLALQDLQQKITDYETLLRNRSSKEGAEALKLFEKKLYSGTLQKLFEEGPRADLEGIRLGQQETEEKKLIDLFLESKVRRQQELASKWRRTPADKVEIKEIFEILRKGTQWS